MQRMTIYGDTGSGNCLKVKWIADRLGLAYDWVHVDVTRGETRTPAYLAMNPSGQIPVVVLPDGRALAQSNAILLHFAHGTDLIPAEPYARHRMFEWLFWEQYSHEPYIAVRRYLKLYLGKTDAELDPKLLERGKAALARMQVGLAETPFLAGDTLSPADICLVAYTRMAHQGGFDLSQFPLVETSVKRIEEDLAIA